MGDDNEAMDREAAAQLFREVGLDGFMEQIGSLQESLNKVAEGMGSLGQNAVRQSQDTENLAAHLLAVEAVLTVILRQIPVDLTEVREEADRRSGVHNSASGEPSVVTKLAEDIVRRADI